jgi:hypothetical protein
MGFSFRRSSSFGPFRLNFSKSGIGASVGVKGARVTLSPKGRTYITVGAGGFSYRQNLSAGSRAPTPRPQYQTVVVQQPSLDEIKTADVEELLASSKSELIENLNRRAQMFNPAILFFVIAALCAVIGMVQLGNSVSPALPALPDVSSSSDASRQANRTDEYALLLARYGQPSAVMITQAGTVPLRVTSWAEAHLAVSFVPAGCFDAYAYFQAHKNDVPPTRIGKRHHATLPATEPGPPPCVPPTDAAATIVAYQDVASGSVIDSAGADRSFTGLSIRSEIPPRVTASDISQAKKHDVKGASPPVSVAYDADTFHGEQRRLADIDLTSRKDMKSGWILLGVAFFVLVPGVFVHRKNREKRATELIYDLSAPATAQQQALEDSLDRLTQSRIVWKLDSQSAITDWKRNAGAAYNVKREQISIRRAVPPRVESNLVPMCIDLGKLKMFFLPDQVLYWQRGMFASIGYTDLKFEAGATRFIEESVQASDSKQVGSTWRYVRKDGGPDRRFNNNRQLPVMLYGVVTAASSGGLNLVFHTSNADVAGSFTTSFRTFQSGRASTNWDHELPFEAAKTGQQNRVVSNIPDDIEAAMGQLGVKPGVTLEELTLAYRHMAQMYHPDKTAGLGPELQTLAEERMKAINAAHQTVRQYLGSA